MADFAFDVAFSLLDQDEPLAKEIDELLRPLPTFLYSGHALELAASDDGALKFAEVFKRDSRTVVILYREGWGKTKWTGFEETAIRDRVLNDGPEIVTLVNLSGSKPPIWFPETRIWTDYKKLGAPGVAAVLKERAVQRGRAVREETPLEMAARLAEVERTEAERLGFLFSDAGVTVANQEAAALVDRITTIAKDISAAVTPESWNAVMLYRDGFSVIITWASHYTNTTRDSAVFVTEYRGRPDFGVHRFVNLEPVKELRTHKYAFDRPAPDDFGWRRDGDGVFISTARLADWAAKLLLERVAAKRR